MIVIFLYCGRCGYFLASEDSTEVPVGGSGDEEEREAKRVAFGGEADRTLLPAGADLASGNIVAPTPTGIDSSLSERPSPPYSPTIHRTIVSQYGRTLSLPALPLH